MRSGTIAFLLGVLTLQQWAQLPDKNWTVLLFLTVPLALFLTKACHKSGRLSSVIHLSAWFFSGFLWALLVAGQILAQGIAPQLEGKDIVIQGRITNLPVSEGRRTRFEFKVEHAWYQGVRLPPIGKVRLNWYGSRSELNPGQPWRLKVRLKRPYGFSSPGSFDYESWLFQHRIRATGYVRQAENNQQTGPVSGYWVQRARFMLKSRLLTILPDQPARALLLALIIGDRSQIDAEQWQILRRTGTNHLLAISGLHIGLVAGLVYWLAQFLWRFSGRGMLYLPAPLVAAGSAIIAALAYAALAGFSIPTQRALIMVVITMLALCRRQHIKVSKTLGLALLGVLIIDPLSVLAPGFWLSFIAVGVIFFALSGRFGQLSRWLQAVRIQVWITFGLFPVLMLLFQQASLTSPLANILAVPLVGLLVVPLALLGCLLLPVGFGLGLTLLKLAMWLLDRLQGGLSHLSGWSLSSWEGVAPDWPVFIVVIIGVVVLLMPRGWPGKGVSIFLLLPLFFYRGEPLEEGEVKLALLDVGQGLATVVMTRNHTLVFDTGPRFSARFDTGNAVVAPYLRVMGIRSIDRLMISHGDNDHIGGARSLLRQFKTVDIVSSVPDKVASQARHCHRGEHWQWDGVSFRILNPSANSRFRGNNASCVLLIKTRDHSVLLTGDIETPAERFLLEEEGGALKAGILVAPHHGSKTSSSAAFIDAVDPGYVLFPVGYRNRYRFPSEQVSRRYFDNLSKTLDTATSGTITFLLGDTDLKPRRFRVENRRYWQTR